MQHPSTHATGLIVANAKKEQRPWATDTRADEVSLRLTKFFEGVQTVRASKDFTVEGREKQVIALATPVLEHVKKLRGTLADIDQQITAAKPKATPRSLDSAERIERAIRHGEIRRSFEGADELTLVQIYQDPVTAPEVREALATAPPRLVTRGMGDQAVRVVAPLLPADLVEREEMARLERESPEAAAAVDQLTAHRIYLEDVVRTAEQAILEVAPGLKGKAA